MKRKCKHEVRMYVLTKYARCIKMSLFNHGYDGKFTYRCDDGTKLQIMYNRIGGPMLGTKNYMCKATLKDATGHKSAIMGDTTNLSAIRHATSRIASEHDASGNADRFLDYFRARFHDVPAMYA